MWIISQRKKNYQVSLQSYWIINPGMGLSTLCSIRLSGWFWCTLMFENHLARPGQLSLSWILFSPVEIKKVSISYTPGLEILINWPGNQCFWKLLMWLSCASQLRTPDLAPKAGVGGLMSGGAGDTRERGWGLPVDGFEKQPWGKPIFRSAWGGYPGKSGGGRLVCVGTEGHEVS